MTKYEKPVLEIVELELDNVILTSNGHAKCTTIDQGGTCGLDANCPTDYQCIVYY